MTDDIVVVSTIDKRIVGRIKTVSRMNVCLGLCALVVGASLGEGRAVGESGSGLPR